MIKEVNPFADSSVTRYFSDLNEQVEIFLQRIMNDPNLSVVWTAKEQLQPGQNTGFIESQVYALDYEGYFYYITYPPEIYPVTFEHSQLYSTRLDLVRLLKEMGIPDEDKKFLLGIEEYGLILDGEVIGVHNRHVF